MTLCCFSNPRIIYILGSIFCNPLVINFTVVAFLSCLIFLLFRVPVVLFGLRGSRLSAFCNTFRIFLVRITSCWVFMLFGGVLCLLGCQLLTRNVWVRIEVPEVLLEVGLVKVKQLEEDFASEG